MKTCIRCKEQLPLTAFNSDTSRPDNLQRRCRECDREYRNNRTPAVATNPKGVTKPCNRCGEELALEMFANNKQGLYGKANRCKPCHQDYKRELKRRKAQGSIVINNYSRTKKRSNFI